MAKAVQPGSPRWRELVIHGINKDANRNWFLGAAALEIAPMGENAAHNGSAERLQQYANEIGIEVNSLRTYRDVVAAWPPPTRVGGTSWKVHQMLMGRRHLIRRGMTVTEAHRVLGQSTLGRTGPRADTAAKVEQAKALLADPAVAEQVVGSWTAEQKAATARELPKDAGVAGQVAEDLDAVSTVTRKRDEVESTTSKRSDRAHDELREEADPSWHAQGKIHAIGAEMNTVAGGVNRIKRLYEEMTRFHQPTEDERDQLLEEVVGVLRRHADELEAIFTAADLSDEKIAAFLGGRP